MPAYSDRAAVSRFDARLHQEVTNGVPVGSFIKGEWPHGSSTRLPSSGDGGALLDYARQGHPGGNRVEKIIGALEMGKHALLFSDGMCAIRSATTTLARPGDTILVHQSLYGGTIRYFNRLADQGFDVRFEDLISDDAGVLIHELRPKLIHIESVTNPSLRVPDLPALMNAAARVNAYMMVDNTLPTAFGCVPLDIARNCGFDRLIVALSLTKGYVAGHLGGAIVTDNTEFAEKLYKTRQAEGGNASTYDVPHFFEGVMTMGARMERLSLGARSLAENMASKAVEGILAIHPMLDGHPDQARARDVLLKNPGVVTLDCNLPDDRYSALTEELEGFFIRSNSFNGNLPQMSESAVQSHAGVKSEEQRAAAGIKRQLIRLSPGITLSPAELTEGFRVVIDRWAAQKPTT